MISEIQNFFNHPFQGGKMSQSQFHSYWEICMTMYLHFGHIYSEMGKENKLACRNCIIYLPKKEMKWNENKALHWIMRWEWMRWKWNLAFNNDDGKKLYTKTIFKNYLHKKIKTLTTIPLHLLSLCLYISLWNRNKIIQKMYYPWIHFTVQTWPHLNKIALQ